MRVGKFYLPKKLVFDEQETTRKLLVHLQFIPLRVELLGYSNHFEMIGLSPHFDEVKEFMETPSYEIVFNGKQAEIKPGYGHTPSLYKI